MTEENTARLLDAIKGIDLTSADGRAGIASILAEIERVSPGAILQRAAIIDLRRMGCFGELPDAAADWKLAGSTVGVTIDNR